MSIDMGEFRDDLKKSEVTAWRKILAGTEAPIDALAVQALEAALERAREKVLELALCEVAATPVDGYRISRGPKLFLPLIGANRVHYPGGAFDVPTNGFGLIPSRFPHREERLTRRGVYAQFFIQITAEALNYNMLLIRAGRPRHVLGPVQRENGRPDLLLTLAAELSERARRQAMEGPLWEGIVQTLLGLLLEQFASGPGNLQHSALIIRARTIIDAELTDRDLTVARLADELRVHPDYLSRQFHQETGQRLKACIQQQRLQLARELFLAGNLNVAEVAQIIGFNDQGYFCRVFRESAGMTPSQYQRETARLG